MNYSVVIPVINEQKRINTKINHLKNMDGIESKQIIVVDGDPAGSTIGVIEDSEVVKITSSRGRAKQMNAGAKVAGGEVIIFLHADTELPPGAFKKISKELEKGYIGGAFKLKLDSENLLINLISHTANLRVDVFGIPYGDQAIFVKKSVFENAGGYPEIPLMEEVEFLRKIKREYGKLKVIKSPVLSSARRWENNGILQTTLKNHLIRFLYLLKVSPEVLANIYNINVKI
ncbi:MAG: TIGR04283 family arsenosugar biosynthesis glycosyltransferase [Elusimicrobiota bacterium]